MPSPLNGLVAIPGLLLVRFKPWPTSTSRDCRNWRTNNVRRQQHVFFKPHLADPIAPRVRRGGHGGPWPLPHDRRISCRRPISKRSPGQTSVVDPYSSMTAGPLAAKPGLSIARWNTCAGPTATEFSPPRSSGKPASRSFPTMRSSGWRHASPRCPKRHPGISSSAGP